MIFFLFILLIISGFLSASETAFFNLKKHEKVNKKVNIQFSGDKPMKIQYDMDDVMDEDDDDEEDTIAKNYIRFFYID